MAQKIILFFLLWFVFVFGGVFFLNDFTAKQIVVEYMAIAGLLLFWLPEIFYNKIKRKK